MASRWENDLVQYLRELTAVQKNVLDVLQRNQQLLTVADSKGMELLETEEQDTILQLQQCLARREKMLQYAKAENLPAESLEMLGKHVVTNQDSEYHKLFETAKHQTRHLHLCGMTNWIITQRSLIHCSQMLEIIATKGRNRPTYTKTHHRNIGITGGSIMDKKA